jgi:CxxC-x17-CxxC domain-containing protein
MEFLDINLKCKDCGAEFVFSAGEQFFFLVKGFKNVPKHCKQCKGKRDRNSRTPIRPQTQTICAGCGAQTTVPFKPTHGKPVFCRSCYQRQILAPAS